MIMEMPALTCTLDVKIRLKLEEIAAQERKLALMRIDLENDMKTLQGIVDFAKTYGFIKEQP